MDYFGKDSLEELLDRVEGPTVSIYLPTSRVSGGAEANRLRFRAALDRARELLGPASGSSRNGGGRALAQLEPLGGDAEFWRRQSDGLAAFAAPDFRRLYRTPVALPELVVVGPTFHTRPMLELLQAPDRYWVLGLSQKEVRLWEGSATGVSPMDLQALPRSMTDALGFEFERDPEIVHRRKAGPSRGRPGRGGHPPIFHGHGAQKEEGEEELRRFFRKVDDGLREMLRDEIGPVVLAAVKEYHSLYREVSRLDNLAEGGVEASVVEWPPEKVREAAWPVAREEAAKQLDRALELWESSYGSGKGEQDLANLARLAVAGRIRLLLTERGRRVWGGVDRETGKLELLGEGGEDPGDDAVEVLDELAEIVLLRGGKALVLPPERFPTPTGAAGVLR